MVPKWVWNENHKSVYPSFGTQVSTGWTLHICVSFAWYPSEYGMGISSLCAHHLGCIIQVSDIWLAWLSLWGFCWHLGWDFLDLSVWSSLSWQVRVECPPHPSSIFFAMATTQSSSYLAVHSRQRKRRYTCFVLRGWLSYRPMDCFFFFNPTDRKLGIRDGKLNPRRTKHSTNCLSKSPYTVLHSL